jgi:hypothetical protein
MHLGKQRTGRRNRGYEHLLYDEFGRQETADRARLSLVW